MRPENGFFGHVRSERSGGRSEADVIHSVPAEPQTGKVSDQEERYLRIKRRARLLDWRILRLDPKSFAIVKIEDELCRHPCGGFTSLDEIEQFVRAREREAGY